MTSTVFPPGRWRATWIWAADAETPAPDSHRVVVLLRRTFTVTDVPATALARLSSVSRHILTVNGKEIARGPVRANPRKQPYDLIDLAPVLREGENTVELTAWRYVDAMPWWLPPPTFSSDLVHGAVVFEAKVGEDWWVTDGSWQAVWLPTWSLSAGAGVSGRGRERLDLQAAVDLSWAPAIVRRASAVGETGRRSSPPSLSVGPIGPRPISWPTPRVVPLTHAGDGVWVSEVGVVAGSIRLTLEAPAGTVAEIRVAELLDASGRPAPTEHDAGFDVVAAGSVGTVETLDNYGLTGLTVSIPGSGSVIDVAVIERQHDIVGSAFFECSDELLNQIWATGRRTVSLCSADAYLDCPTREQRAWSGDSVVHQMVDLTTNTDWSLARWHPRLAASPRPDGMLPMAVAGDVEHYDFTVIPDWALHWAHSVHNLYVCVGDRDEIAELLPAVEGVIRWFTTFLDDHGTLVDVPGWVIIDWSSVAGDGVSAALNGLWGRALLEFAAMADWLGDAGRAAWARSLHDRLREGFQRLWDPKRERYADQLLAGELLPAASQHGQAAAIVGGLVPADLLPRLVEVITDETRLVHAAWSAPDGPALPNSDTAVGGGFLRDGLPEPWWDVEELVVRAQPFFRYVVHDALAAAGRPDLVTSGCRDWKIALERCATTWTETWYGGTISHGWSSTPTRDLMMRTLGVRSVEPGFATAIVDPALADLTWAKGAVPTPAGLIRVEVTVDRLTVHSPVPVIIGGVERPAGRTEVSR